MDYSELDSLIAELERVVDDISMRRHGSRHHPGDAWTLIKRIGSAFKGMRYPQKQDKDRAWERFQSLVERAKFEQRVSSRESEAAKDEICRIAEGARPPNALLSDLSDLMTDVFAAPIAAAMTLGFAEIKSSHQIKKEELTRLSARLRDAWNLFGEKKRILLPTDRQETFGFLKQVQEQLDAAWDEWKRAADRIHRAREDAFHERQARRHERISTLEERRSRLRSVIDRQEDHLRDLYDKRASAWSDGYRDRVDGWIREVEDRLSDMRHKLSDIEGWLDEERRKLR